MRRQVIGVFYVLSLDVGRQVARPTSSSTHIEDERERAVTLSSCASGTLLAQLVGAPLRGDRR